MDAATRSLVFSRARNRCEYCQLPQGVYQTRFHIDHIVASQHAGNDHPANLALSCPRCNRKKGPNLSCIDPQSGSVVFVFNPRRDSWIEHFRWEGPKLAGLTPIGRATIVLLDINNFERVQMRQSLMEEGRFSIDS